MCLGVTTHDLRARPNQRARMYRGPLFGGTFTIWVCATAEVHLVPWCTHQNSWYSHPQLPNISFRCVANSPFSSSNQLDFWLDSIFDCIAGITRKQVSIGPTTNRQASLLQDVAPCLRKMCPSMFPPSKPHQNSPMFSPNVNHQNLQNRSKEIAKEISPNHPDLQGAPPGGGSPVLRRRPPSDRPGAPGTGPDHLGIEIWMLEVSFWMFLD